ncbi:hypothetical protein BGX38DRAFT_1209059 [Terfezia claveryi]|nr:hypothetical protein BGX38DRAFT_1209059 [Terfezia claveryi]
MLPAFLFLTRLAGKFGLLTLSHTHHLHKDVSPCNQPGRTFFFFGTVESEWRWLTLFAPPVTTARCQICSKAAILKSTLPCAAKHHVSIIDSALAYNVVSILDITAAAERHELAYPARTVRCKNQPIKHQDP